MRLFVRLPVPLRRVGYRFAYAVLRIYWLIAHPRADGVKCVLVDDGRVLLVRHTYGPAEWDLPGGSIKSGEPALDAARRETEEELGIRIDDWIPLGEMSGRVNHRRDALHSYQASIDGASLNIDRGEIDTAQLFNPAELPPDLGRYVRPILETMRLG